MHPSRWPYLLIPSTVRGISVVSRLPGSAAMSILVPKDAFLVLSSFIALY